MTGLGADRDDAPKRRPGRPRSPDPKTSISAWIPVRHYDRLTRIAVEQDASLSRLVGEAVQHLLRRQKP